MKSVKIAHCADIHLGSEISSLGHLGIRRRAQIKQTFFDILHICKEQQVEYLLIAGDLYEQTQPEEQLVQEVADEFARYPEIKIVITPGNHDYISENSHYNREGLYPNNVFIFKDEWSYIDFPEDQVRIWGAGFRNSYRDKPLLMNAIETDINKSSWIQIGVLHGELVNNSGESKYNPITKQQIASCGLDYLALGHIHLRTLPEQEGNVTYAYCGCHEGRGFDELGPKGIYMGQVGQGICNLRFVPMCKKMYLHIIVDLTGITTVAEAANRITESVDGEVKKIQSEEMDCLIEENHLQNEAQYYQPEDQIYKITLTGVLEDGVVLREEDLKARLNSYYYMKFQNHTSLQVDYKEAAKAKTLKGMYVKKMLERIQELEQAGKLEEAKKYRMGLEIGWKAFNCEVKYHENS